MEIILYISGLFTSNAIFAICNIRLEILTVFIMDLYDVSCMLCVCVIRGEEVLFI